MTNLTHLFNDDHVGAAWHGFLLASTIGGFLLRLLLPGTGRHRRTEARWFGGRR